MKQQYVLFFAILSILFLSCSDEDPVANIIDVQGTWTGVVTIASCAPADVCESVGFPAGGTLNGVLILTQDRGELEGTYSYTGLPVNVPVAGRVGGSQVGLEGAATSQTGSVTAGINGAVSGNSMQASVSHQITLTDGRAAIVAGSGTLTR